MSVIVCDYSEAHGDHGEVWAIQPNGIILVLLDGEEPRGIWPILASEELEPEEHSNA